jgi:hypothetical protein
VDAVAPGKRPWKTTFEIQKDSETRSIDIPALVVLPPENRPATEKNRGPSPWIFVAGSVGVLGFGAMALGGIEALSKWSDRTAACGIGGDPNACTQAGIDADKLARTWAIVADIGLGVGVAGTVTTIILIAVGRGKAKEAPAHVSFSPVVSPHSMGVALSAVF